MSTTRAEIDAKASGERRAFMLRMNAALEQAKAEHAAGCDANLARWRDAPIGVEDTDAMLAFDDEAKRLMDIADARLDELQQESELEHARIAREHEEALRALAAAAEEVGGDIIDAAEAPAKQQPPTPTRETRAARFQRRQQRKLI